MKKKKSIQNVIVSEELYEDGNVKVVRKYSENGGLMSEIFYKSGEDAGKILVKVSYHNDGKKALTITNLPIGTIRTRYKYKAGRLTSDVSRHETGELYSQTLYYANGNKKEYRMYHKNGQPSLIVDYFENGNKSVERQYRENGTISLVIGYDERGKQKFRTEYNLDMSIASKVGYEEPVHKSGDAHSSI